MELSAQDDNFRLGLLRYGYSLPIDCFQDRISAALEQGVAYGFSELNGVGAVSRLAQKLRSVGIGHDRLEVQLSAADFGESANGYLAAASQLVEQRSLAHSRSARRSVFQ